MKNNLKYFFLLVISLTFATACSDDDKVTISTSKITLNKITVVKAVQDDEAVETTTSFFTEGDYVDFSYVHTGKQPVRFYAERGSSSWEALSDTLYYKDIYPDGKEPESFTAEFGSKNLTTDQSTTAKFHEAHYLTGDAYVKSTNAYLLVDSMVNQHVQIIIKVIRSNNWPGSPSFESVMNGSALTIHTTGDDVITPLYDTSLKNTATYFAVLPVGTVPGAGQTLFTVNGEPLTYRFIEGYTLPTAGQTLVVTARYNYGTPIEATAMTKDAWDTAEGSKYGYTGVSAISAIEDLEAFAITVSAGVDYTGKSVTLMKDLDLQGEEIAPIGTQDWPFNGTFNGGKHTISNFVIEQSVRNAGLFGSLGVDGTIKDLTMEKVWIETEASHAAIMAGSNYGYIVDCEVYGGTVIGGNYVGGIAGYNDGTIVGCQVSGTSISSIQQERAIAGGIAGFNYRNVTACNAAPKSVDVLTRSDNKFGLLIGENSNAGVINKCSWEESSLPGVGYSVVMPGNSSTDAMNQAIKEYNSGKKEGEARYSNKVW